MQSSPVEKSKLPPLTGTGGTWENVFDLSAANGTMLVAWVTAVFTNLRGDSCA
ncbi:unnamed protein product, partial [marine sediment metagenome]